MNRIKALVLAAVAIAALMATVGSSTASATLTSLCEVKETKNGIPVCPAKYGKGITVHAELETGTKMIVETPLGKAECSVGTIKFFTLQETEIPLKSVVESFNIEKCGEYTVTPTLGFLDIEIIDIPIWTHNGTLTFTEEEVVVQKGEAICEYSVGHTGVLTGSAITATIDLSATLARIGGNAKCPEGNGKWAAALTVTSPAPLWVST